MRVLFFVEETCLNCCEIDHIAYDEISNEIYFSDMYNNCTWCTVHSSLESLDGRAFVHQACLNGNVDLCKFKVVRIWS